MNPMAIVRFICPNCGDRQQPTADLVVIRGMSTRYAIRCGGCQALKVGVLDPAEICQLLARDVRIIGDADLDSLIVPADTADIDNPPTP